jgi:hypothetical protein
MRDAAKRAASLAAIQRANQALALRQRGMTFEAIAAELGYCNKAHARRPILTALRRNAPHDIKQARHRLSRRLWDILQLIEPQAVVDAVGDAADANGGHGRRDCRLLDRVLAIYAQLRSLNGLDARRKFVGDVPAPAPQPLPLETRQQMLRSQCGQAGLVAVEREDYLKLLHLAELGRKHQWPAVLEYVDGVLRPVAECPSG